MSLADNNDQLQTWNSKLAKKKKMETYLDYDLKLKISCTSQKHLYAKPLHIDN